MIKRCTRFLRHHGSKVHHRYVNVCRHSVLACRRLCLSIKKAAAAAAAAEAEKKAAAETEESSWDDRGAASEKEDGLRAGAVGDTDLVSGGGGVPDGMVRVECAGGVDQRNQCWTNSVACGTTNAGAETTGHDLRQRLEAKCSEVFTVLNPDKVDTFYKSLSFAAEARCVESLVRQEARIRAKKLGCSKNDPAARAAVMARLHRFNEPQKQLCIVQQHIEDMGTPNTCWSELEIKHLCDFNLIDYDIMVHFDGRRPELYKLRDRGTSTRPRFRGTVHVWYGCAPGADCGHVMALLPIRTDEDALLAASDLYEMAGMSHICEMMRAGTKQTARRHTGVGPAPIGCFQFHQTVEQIGAPGGVVVSSDEDSYRDFDLLPDGRDLCETRGADTASLDSRGSEDAARPRTAPAAVREMRVGLRDEAADLLTHTPPVIPAAQAAVAVEATAAAITAAANDGGARIDSATSRSLDYVDPVTERRKRRRS